MDVEEKESESEEKGVRRRSCCCWKHSTQKRGTSRCTHGELRLLFLVVKGKCCRCPRAAVGVLLFSSIFGQSKIFFSGLRTGSVNNHRCSRRGYTTYVWHRMATNYGAVVVTPSYVLQPSRVDVIIAAPPYQGDSFVESYGGNLFSCTDDVQSCCFAWLCMPGATGNIAGFGAGKNEEDNGCSCLQHCCGMFLCPFFWSCWGVSARGLLEERLALEHLQQPLGDMCSDFFRQACCGCCATAQSLRAIKNFKRQNGTSSNSYVKHAGGVESVEMER